jgi:hypothetical protein
MNKIKNFIIFIIIILTTGCGYNVVKQSGKNNFNIIDVSSSGEKKINYKIKNKLLFNSSKESVNLIQISIDTDKTKIIKEKNVKNQITKYQLTVNAKIQYSKLNKVKKNSFTVNQTEDLNVTSSRLQTLNNEKKIIESMVDKLVEEILDELNSRLNDI